MGDDTGPRRSDASSSRRRQPGFPFWVVRGARATNHRPPPAAAAMGRMHDGVEATSGRPEHAEQRQAPAHAGHTNHTGRTGVDLRARVPSAPRPAPAASRPSRRLALPWKRFARPAQPLQPPSSPRNARSAVRRSRRSAIALIGLVVVQALFLAAIAWGLTSPTFQARSVQVQGTSDPMLLAAIHRLPLSGCNIFRCDLASRARLVEALPAVGHAEVRAIYPDGLLVTVTPRRPTLLWRTGEQSLVVASDGTVLGPLASDPAYAHLSLLPISDPDAAAFAGQIPRPGYQIPAAEAEMAGQLRTGITGTLGNGWTLQWTAEEGFVASDGSGTQIVFGTPADAAQALTSYPDPATLAATPTVTDVDHGVAAQLQVLQALRTRLAQSGQHAVLIDLRWGPHPYYRLASGA